MPGTTPATAEKRSFSKPAVAVLLSSGLAVAAVAAGVSPASAGTTTTSVNDTSFTYAGSWNVSSGTTKFRSDDHYTSAPGATFRYRFTGTSVKVYATRAAHHGIMGISVDGGTETKVDLYSSTRADQVLVHTSRTLAYGTHTVTVRATGTKSSSSRGTVITADRLDVLTTTATPTITPTATPAPSTSTAWRTILADQFNTSMSLTTTTNGVNPNWWVESGSGPFVSNGATLKRTNNTQFDRIFSAKRFGGPGKTVRYRYRARMTKLYSDGGWGGYRGIKTGMKFPTSCSGYSKDDPRSVYGKPPGGSDSCTPGSYISVDGIMEDGRYEVARNGYGTGGYAFKYGPKRAYSVGTWVEKTVEIAWIGGDDVRFRFWNNATATGTPVWETTDTSSPFAQPGFLWWRLDYADGEWDYFVIEERAT